MKMAKAFRSTAHEALSALTGMTRILIELENQTKIYHNTRGNEKRETYDAPKHYSHLNHPADAIELKEKKGNRIQSGGIYGR